MTTSTSLHHAKAAERNKLPSVKNHSLAIVDDEGNTVSIYVPPHVAAATAKAFNRAMQVKVGKIGLVYVTRSMAGDDKAHAMRERAQEAAQ